MDIKNLRNSAFAMREKRKPCIEELHARVDAAPYGEKSKEYLHKVLQYESTGGACFGLFPVAPMIERAEGSILYDMDGKEYIDFLSGFSVSQFGNCDPQITKIIQEQAAKLTHYFDLPHPERVNLAEKLCKNSKISGNTKVAFGVTGSDGIELAIRAARYYTGKQNILVAYGDYHGVTYGTMALTSKGNMQPNFYPVSPDQHVGYFYFPHEYRTPDEEFSGHGMEAIKALERGLEGKETPYGDGMNGNNVAAILVEPFQSSAGYYIPPKAYLQELRRICDRFGILLIVDEIQAGLGRSGKLWAFEHSEIEPDMFVTSKALGGAVPIAAVVAREEILSEWPASSHISTQAGNVLACACGNYVLDTISDPKFLESVNERGAYFRAGWEALMDKHPLIGYIDNKGMYTGIELVKDRKTKEPAVEAANVVLDGCLREGIVLEKGGYYYNRLQLIPALNMPKEVMDEAFKKFDKIFTEAGKYI